MKHLMIIAICFFSLKFTNAQTSKKPCAKSLYDQQDYPMEYDSECYNVERFKEWKSLINYRPNRSVLRKLATRGLRLQCIEDDNNPIRDIFIGMDYYSIKINDMPIVNGEKISGADLLSYFGSHINKFLRQDNSTFKPHTNTDRRSLRRKYGMKPGTVIDIQMKYKGMKVDKGLVVSSGQSTKEIHSHTEVSGKFTFSTLEHGLSYLDNNHHPVSGNREFGFKKEGDDYVFYTRGADRITGFTNISGGQFAFDQQDKLWKSFQRKLVNFVNKNGGYAYIKETVSRRLPWSDVKNRYWKSKSACPGRKQPVQAAPAPRPKPTPTAGYDDYGPSEYEPTRSSEI